MGWQHPNVMKSEPRNGVWEDILIPVCASFSFRYKVVLRKLSVDVDQECELTTGAPGL